jgi:hypothetical protein
MEETECAGEIWIENRRQREAHDQGLNRHRLLAVMYFLLVWKADKYLDS